jgi:hypothetical protein
VVIIASVGLSLVLQNDPLRPIRPPTRYVLVSRHLYILSDTAILGLLRNTYSGSVFAIDNSRAHNYHHAQY